tara:strand:- start:1330 stop:1551 length:222 start_codon:yes stop_codon:yes gene_type:complete
MTPKQSEVMKFVNKYWNDKGYSPSLREVQEGLEIKNLRSVHLFIDGLEKRGYLTKIKHAHRSIEPTAKGKAFV